MTEENVYNVLLIGVDRTTSTENANSDSMILLSVNYEKKQISMVSLMRDTCVDIPGIGYRKLNAAYANGGGPLLAETVTENFKINVDRYMAVSFKDMIDIIDAVGAISITFTEKEAVNANQTMEHMCQNMNIEDRYPEYMIPGAGTYECCLLYTSGMTGDCRILVMNKKKRGAMVIKVRGTRFAIGKSIAEHIEVREDGGNGQ